MQIDGNKFQVTSSDSNKFMVISNCNAFSILNNTLISSDSGTGELTNECINISSSNNGVISNNNFKNIQGAGMTLINADNTLISDNTFSAVEQPSIQFESLQSKDVIINGNLFEGCGTVATHNVIQCNTGKQTRVIISNNIFSGTLGDYDIEASNTCYLLDNIYTNQSPSTDVNEVSFTGINRYLQVDTDADDVINPSASYDQVEAVAVVSELHNLKSKLRASGFLAQ